MRPGRMRGPCDRGNLKAHFGLSLARTAKVRAHPERQVSTQS